MNTGLRTGLLFTLIIFSATFSQAQTGRTTEGRPAARAPEDRPIQVKSEELRRYEEAIRPSVEKARKTYPEARKRYLAGLPRGYTFYLTTQLRDREGRFEQTFIEVREIRNRTVKGIIANDIRLVSGYRIGDAYSFPESEILDWTITAPDGTEEGNFVGKFLDEYQKQNP
jgi:hypothetical protein